MASENDPQFTFEEELIYFIINILCLLPNVIIYTEKYDLPILKVEKLGSFKNKAEVDRPKLEGKKNPLISILMFISLCFVDLISLCTFHSLHFSLLYLFPLVHEEFLYSLFCDL